MKNQIKRNKGFKFKIYCICYYILFFIGIQIVGNEPQNSQIGKSLIEMLSQEKLKS